MQVDRTSPYFDNNQRPIISAFATILEKCVFRLFPMLIISRPVVTSNVGSGISAVIGRVTDGFLSVQQALCFGEKIVREGKGVRGGGGEAFSLFPLPSSPRDQRPVHRLADNPQEHLSPLHYLFGYEATQTSSRA